MFETFLIVLVIIAFSTIFLGVRFFFGKSFINTHVHDSKALHQQGIGCAKEQARNAFIDNPHRVNEKRSRI